MSFAQDSFLPLLKRVSRSFYLTMRALPKGIRFQIGVGYLLARAADTVADTDVVPADIRVVTLERLREAILNPTLVFPVPEKEAEWKTLLAAQADSGEKTLLENVAVIIREIECFSPEDRQDVHTVLDIITSGQLLDLERFIVGAQPGRIRALQNEDELDDYTYRVAGCVGEFWTRICRRHLYPQAELEEETFFKLAVHFGKGLQLVNILRDLPADLGKGRCYLPEESLKKLGLTPEDLLHPESYAVLCPYYKWYLAKALFYLQDAAVYVQQTPRGFRTWLARYGCVLPILIGVKTLQLLGDANPLDAAQRVKVPRKEVKRFIVGVFLRGLLPNGWNKLLAAAIKEASEHVVHNAVTQPISNPKDEVL